MNVEQLGAAGRHLFDAVTSRFSLDEHEQLVLVQAARTADLIDRLDAARGDELFSATGSKVHPGVIEARMQRSTLARLLSSLRLPDDPAVDEDRRQRRPLRGVHSMGA